MNAKALLLDSWWEFSWRRAHTVDLSGQWFQEYQEAKHELLFYSSWWQEAQREPQKLYYLEFSWELQSNLFAEVVDFVHGDCLVRLRKQMMVDFLEWVTTVTPFDSINRMGENFQETSITTTTKIEKATSDLITKL